MIMGTPMIKPKKVRQAIAPNITSNRPMVFLSGLKVKAAAANNPSTISAKIMVPLMPVIWPEESRRSMARFSPPPQSMHLDRMRLRPILASVATRDND